MSIPLYTKDKFKNTGVIYPRDGLFIRPGIVDSINQDKSTVNISWLDHPGIRQDVAITQPHLGMHQFPTPGTVVLIGFNKVGDAQILRYLPAGYNQQVADNDIWGIKPGELNLMSYRAESVPTKSFPIPNATGSKIHMDNVGNIQISTMLNEFWRIDTSNNEIAQNSMNYEVNTEAGILQFGLTKRDKGIITPEGDSLEKSTSLNPDALTEFNLRLLETADATTNLNSDPALDNPFIELSLGIKVDAAGDLVKTESDKHAKTTGNAQEIIIQLKTKTDQGFEFTVDKEGNLTLLTKGNIKLKSEKNINIDIEKDAEINVGGSVKINSGDISLAGDSAIVLSSFLNTYDNHTHTVPSLGSPTTMPLMQSKPSHITKKTKAG